jgi:hypothetical protein
MAKKIKAKISWNKKSPLTMAGVARGVATSLNGNARFTSPPVTSAVLNAAATRVENAWANRMNGQLAKDELNNASDALDELMHTLVDYVTSIANGDESIIHSANFETTSKMANRLSAPEAAAAPIITAAPRGVIKVKVNGVKGAKIYSFILVIDGDFNVVLKEGYIDVPIGTNALIINSTKGNVVFEGLPGLKKVSVAVIVFNSSGSSGFSPVVNGSTLV